jgi:hypothetical protein
MDMRVPGACQAPSGYLRGSDPARATLRTRSGRAAHSHGAEKHPLNLIRLAPAEGSESADPRLPSLVPTGLPTKEER